ncbi:hypothetical protein N9W89_11025 [Hellea sp.]|nr:hypothetical protein [Hellea sp.]
MSSDTQSLKALWQSLPSQKVVFNHRQMQQRADKFQAKHKRRDIIEYLAWGVFFLLVIYMLTGQSYWTDVMWVGLTVIGAIIAIWGYYRRMGYKTMPSSNSADNLVDFMRRELTRQRDGAATYWRWYLLPFAPGILFLFVVRWLENGSTLMELTEMRIALIMAFVLIMAFSAACVLWQFLCAARYQRQLDELETYTRP